MSGLLALSHYTRAWVLEPRSVNQDNRRGDKPFGLWVSVDGEDDWPAWCRSEQWGDIDGDRRFSLQLSADAAVLRLETPEDISAFTDRFALDRTRWRIDWMAVAREWQGIIIAPYQWSCRLGRDSWYYTWDCASGCLWDASAISSVREVVTA